MMYKVKKVKMFVENTGELLLQDEEIEFDRRQIEVMLDCKSLSMIDETGSIVTKGLYIRLVTCPQCASVGCLVHPKKLIDSYTIWVCKTYDLRISNDMAHKFFEQHPQYVSQCEININQVIKKFVDYLEENFQIGIPNRVVKEYFNNEHV